MNESINNQWREFLETPRGTSEPTKLDTILAERMKAFIKARKVKPFRVKNES